MQTRTAETLVPSCPTTAYDAALALASRVWGVGPEDVVTAQEAELLVHAVPLDGETNCWLTWTFESAGASFTRVHLSHDDAAVDDGGPEPELDAVLGMLLTAVMPTQPGTEQTREDMS